MGEDLIITDCSETIVRVFELLNCKEFTTFLSKDLECRAPMIKSFTLMCQPA